MSTPERCLEQAREAERLASLVSYERDRARLMGQAAEWRARAAELEAEGPAPAAPEVAAGVGRRGVSPWRRLLRALLHPRGSRDG